MPDLRIRISGSDPGDGSHSTGPPRIAGIKAFLVLLLLISLLIGVVIAALVLGSLVAAAILFLAAVGTVVAVFRYGFRRITRGS